MISLEAIEKGGKNKGGLRRFAIGGMTMLRE
jgi:hypothetical protein